MKKIGFVDYYLDEWHANNYPQYIKELSNGRYEVCFAYGQIDSPVGGRTNEQWSRDMNILLLSSIEEVVEKSDFLILLSPDNPEMHEELSKLVLTSQKLCYVDKTFAPDKATAERIFEYADKHNTKCYSSSALRFSSELDDIDKESVYKIYSEGPGKYDMYSIHQIEPIVCLMKARAKRVMALGDMLHPSMVIEFEDGRLAQMRQCQGEEVDFKITAVNKENEPSEYVIHSDYFELFIKSLIKYFDSGVVPVLHEQTIDVIAIREAGLRAFENPFNWIEL